MISGDGGTAALLEEGVGQRNLWGAARIFGEEEEDTNALQGVEHTEDHWKKRGVID
jgi:hypothetical protein